MKKIIIIILLFAGCQKETVKCNCGLILDDNSSNFSILIRNDCSDNEKWFYLTKGDWMNAHVGNNYCITNVDNW
jgi:hypothetical protein